MEEDYRNKIITFENGKLLCNGEEISIEEAERIVQLQVKAMEDGVTDYIQENPELESKDINNLSNTVIETRLDAASNTIDVRGLEEYYDVARDILKAHEIVNRSLSFFSMKNKSVKLKKDEVKEELDIKWPGNINNEPDYQPSVSEMNSVMINLLFKEVIYTQFKKQFNHSALNIEKEHINAQGAFDKGFDVFIRNDRVDIYFRIDENENKFNDIDGNFVASALRVGDYKLQNTTQNISKNANNNLKVAQTLDNAIIKEIRFLKNNIKQEINFSLEKSISRAEERHNLARFFISNFEFFIDRKTRKKLDKILSESENSITENKKLKIRDTDDLDIFTNESEPIIEEELNVENLIRKSISENFEIEIEKITINIKNNSIYEIFLSGQKIVITIIEQDVSVSSSNTIGTGKTDFQQNNIYGANINEKIENACFMATIPLFNRQVENITNNIKGKEFKKTAKEIDKSFKDIFNVLISKENVFERIDMSRQILSESLDSLIYIGDKIDEGLFEIIDKILIKLNLQVFHFLKIEEFANVGNSYKPENGILAKYKVSDENTFIEKIEEIKKFINRLVYRDLIISEIEEYKKGFSIQNFEKKLEEMVKYENKIRVLADKLSEDILLGGSARRLMALLDTSITSKNEMFKFNLDEIIIEMLKTNL